MTDFEFLDTPITMVWLDGDRLFVKAAQTPGLALCTWNLSRVVLRSTLSSGSVSLFIGMVSDFKGANILYFALGTLDQRWAFRSSAWLPEVGGD